MEPHKPNRPPPKPTSSSVESTKAKKRALKVIDSPQEPRRKRVKRGDAEKRPRRYRSKAPLSYIERAQRARTQRMFLIERKRTTSEDGTHEEEIFDIAGSTGNIYQVTISKIPMCSCPDNLKGNQCKHIIYVMLNVFKAREDLAYQLALLSTELAEIFASAPITQKSPSTSTDSLSTDTGGTRKPIEGDCPVCVMEFSPGEELVWCRAACGQNIHRTCFQQWQRSKPGQTARCVFCRSAWKGEDKDLGKIPKSGRRNSEGYVNVAGELGISRERDMSSYHSYWVRMQRGYG